MREYKFRVYDKDMKKMHICGEDIHDEISFSSEDNKAYYYNLQNGCGSLTENSSYILMQYTGLHDKNGKEIYEGDIVKDAWGINMLVKYINTGFYLCRKNTNGEYSKISNWRNLQTKEVIGNIYNNPELLEVQNEQ